MAELKRLVAGFRAFRATYFEQRPELFKGLAARGQQPRVLVVACSDSRVDPAILLNAQPGDLFIIRNVANLIPPYQPDGHYHGTSAALEFGVCQLGVKHVIVLGHSQCGGIRALRSACVDHIPTGEFITPWVSLVSAPCCGGKDPNCEHAAGMSPLELEQFAVKTSLDNLMTFPWVAERVQDGRLACHGWWFDLEKGALFEYGAAEARFRLLAGEGN